MAHGFRGDGAASTSPAHVQVAVAVEVHDQGHENVHADVRVPRGNRDPP